MVRDQAGLDALTLTYDILSFVSYGIFYGLKIFLLASWCWSILRSYSVDRSVSRKRYNRVALFASITFSTVFLGCILALFALSRTGKGVVVCFVEFVFNVFVAVSSGVLFLMYAVVGTKHW